MNKKRFCAQKDDKNPKFPLVGFFEFCAKVINQIFKRKDSLKLAIFL